MKTPEEYYKEWHYGHWKILDLIKDVQKEAYNKALEDAAKNAVAGSYWVDKDSILKLKINGSR